MAARILVVDDVPAVRRGLCSLLASYELEICGEAENGKQAVDQVQELYPDIVVLDISMPVMDGLRATMEIRRVAPSTKIVLFSIHDGPQAKTAARMVGADALVSKAAAVFDLVPTLRRLSATLEFVN
jgi:two-component system, NarL family, nitrate/nitrite response regulator NarL